ncbi:MAG: hypothetical protein ACTS8P_02085, partial [Arsenophonus sp. NC-XBC3-MAG3]
MRNSVLLELICHINDLTELKNTPVSELIILGESMGLENLA